MTGRAIPEWVGSTPDAKVPDRVRQRVFDRHGGVCYLSGILIAGKPWQIEHVKPLHMGGEHRESNLAPALVEYHAIKSAAEAKIKAKADRQARRASGAIAPKQPINSAPFPRSGRRSSNPMPGLPPRVLFREA